LVTEDNHTPSCTSISNSKLYFDSNDSLYCLNAETGEKIWSLSIGYTISSNGPTVDNGKVYIGTYNVFYCLDADTGDIIWVFDTPYTYNSACVVSDGKVYFASHGLSGSTYSFLCLDSSNGNEIWRQPLACVWSSSPAIDDGKVYIGAEDGLHCFNANTGDKIWQYGFLTHSSSPAIANGRVYIGSEDRNVYCLDMDTGEVFWTYLTGDQVLSSPAVSNGKVYITSMDRTIYCLDTETGNCIWSQPNMFSIMSSPAVTDNGIYIGTHNSIYFLDVEAGFSIWNYNVGSVIRTSPAIANGKLYFGADDNKIYCIGDFSDINIAISSVTYEPDPPKKNKNITFFINISIENYDEKYFDTHIYVLILLDDMAIEERALININHTYATVESSVPWPNDNNNYDVKIVANCYNKIPELKGDDNIWVKTIAASKITAQYNIITFLNYLSNFNLLESNFNFRCINQMDFYPYLEF